MQKLENGDLIGLTAFKPATTPRSIKCEDTLMNATEIKNTDRELLISIIDKWITANRVSNSVV